MKERFLNDVKEHEMKIQQDEGVYRHIVFKRPNSGTYRFDIVTYPGHLVVSGDMGCYVFSRLHDMFEFFSTVDNQLNINLGYWTEKLVSISSYGSKDGKIWEFSAEKSFNNLSDYIDEMELDEADKESLIEQLKEASDESEFIDICSDNDIADGYEYISQNPTFHVEWILYAIKWAILKYQAGGK